MAHLTGCEAPLIGKDWLARQALTQVRGPQPAKDTLAHPAPHACPPNRTGTRTLGAERTTGSSTAYQAPKHKHGSIHCNLTRTGRHTPPVYTASNAQTRPVGSGCQMIQGATEKVHRCFCSTCLPRAKNARLLSRSGTLLHEQRQQVAQGAHDLPHHLQQPCA